MKKQTKQIKEADAYCIEHGFVTFDQAKRLKEMGYHYPTHGCFMVPRNGIHAERGIKWDFSENVYSRDYNDDNDAEFSFEYVAAPTLAEVHEILREKHIYITINTFFDNTDLESEDILFDFIIHDYYFYKDNPTHAIREYQNVYKTYNHALSDAVTEGLKLYSKKI